MSMLTGCARPAAVQQEETSGVRPRVGVYDSRAVAVAFFGSEVYDATEGKALAELRAEYEKAKSEGATQRMEELGAKGKALQVLAHKQGFSTAPVDNILAHIQDQIPEIAQKAGVETILSKWDKDALAKYPNAELVDVTMELVDALKPKPGQRQSAIEIQKVPPISLKDAERIED